LEHGTGSKNCGENNEDDFLVHFKFLFFMLCKNFLDYMDIFYRKCVLMLEL
jgi:hypothetical protein